MAGGYGCADDDCTNPVNWLLTHMQPPGTIPVCDDHAPVFTIGILAGQLGVDNARLYDAIKRHVDKEAKRLAAEAQAAEAAEAQAAEAQAAEADHGQALGAEHRAGDKSMADVIPEDWSGETL